MNTEDIKEEIATISRKIKYGFARRTDMRAKFDLRLTELKQQLEEMQQTSASQPRTGAKP